MHSSMRWLHQAALCLILLGGHALADGGVSAAVQVKGLVSQPATFGPADLARMEVREVMLRSGNALPRGYRGVLHLSDAEGRVALVSTGDVRSGTRHVRWLESIDVRRALP